MHRFHALTSTMIDEESMMMKLRPAQEALSHPNSSIQSQRYFSTTQLKQKLEILRDQAREEHTRLKQCSLKKRQPKKMHQSEKNYPLTPSKRQESVARKQTKLVQHIIVNPEMPLSRIAQQLKLNYKLAKQAQTA